MKLIVKSFYLKRELQKMINILFLFFCLATSCRSQRIDGMQSASKEDLALQGQLDVLNKLPLKSIHTKSGYTVDCIDIYKQPAFDHPLLKNHKLQRKLSFHQTIAKTSGNNSSSKPTIGLQKGLCPTGSVPIRRTTKDDLLRVKSLLNSHILAEDGPGSHVAEVTLITIPDHPYYGVSGTNSIYNPEAKGDQTSSAHIWVQNGQADGTNKIIVGWHVSPQLHGDDATYVYSLWTSDNWKKTGCYNLQCPGFVQTDSDTFIGVRVDNTSVYGGTMIEMTIALIQDANTKNWWLRVDDKMVGYFPAALFSNMTTADKVGWGGTTTAPVGSPSPPMGSGYFPDDNFVHACYFSHIAYQNESRKDVGPEKYRTDTFTDKPNCFGVKYYDDPGREMGYSLQFGGPGGNCD